MWPYDNLVTGVLPKDRKGKDLKKTLGQQRKYLNDDGFLHVKPMLS